MTERERLIELIDGSNVLQCCGCHYNSIKYYENKIADYLLANGVIVPPVKVGDTVYYNTYKRGESIGIQPHKVESVNIIVAIERPYGYVGAKIYNYEIGKTVFLTKEEAEKALKGGVE